MSIYLYNYYNIHINYYTLTDVFIYIQPNKWVSRIGVAKSELNSTDRKVECA